LGPSFEEVKEEKAQTEELKEEEKPDKGKKYLLLENVKEPSAFLRMSKGLWSEPVGPFIFEKELHKF